MKTGNLIFLLAVGGCWPQSYSGRCCAMGVPPSQIYALDLTVERFATDSAGTGDLPSGETVSAARLSHNPPRPARKAFILALNAHHAGDYQRAAAGFERAIAIDPEFSEAHGNLGVEYTWTGRLADSVSEFRRTLQLDPATALHHTNFSFTLIKLKRFPEAEAEAQAAVGLDPADGVAHFLLGWLLARRPETRPLSENHLLYAVRTVPEAHLALAQLYGAQGASQLADTEVKRYHQAAALSTHTGKAVTGFVPRP
jgi:Tfp pilus assembly protein PilF